MDLDQPNREGSESTDRRETADKISGRKPAGLRNEGVQQRRTMVTGNRADKKIGATRTTEISQKAGGKAGASQSQRLGLWGRLRRIIVLNLFSSLSRRIATLNLAALVVLLSGILYLNQFREGLIDARVESLLIQGRIIAGAIAASASVDTNAITLDPEKLLELQAGESAIPSRDAENALDFPLNPELVAPLLRNLIKPTRTRARVYDGEGSMLVDSRHLYAGGQVLRFELPPISEQEPGMIDRIGKTLNRWLQRNDLPVYRELTGPDNQYPEVREALVGGPATIVRMTEQGELIVSVAVPIQRFRAVHGVLLLSTQGGDIDRIVAEERIQIMRVFLVASIVTIILSILLASTIANPLRKLSEAAVRVRRGIKSRVEIPDFSSRQDEIGNLSAALRSMTNSLYGRIEAIERFAADVSHELKNPLTSLRSAVETLPLARNQSSRKRLMQVIQHDVLRLDRLITDISDASRLDADLVREDAEKIDVRALLHDVVAVNQEIKRKGRSLVINLEADEGSAASGKYQVMGHRTRLGQVFTNLIDNARSFVPAKGGVIDIAIARADDCVEITVQDNGPGVQAENVSRIFERFYTDRVEEDGFGQNSGLGLSISKQIVEAYGGTISVENVLPEPAADDGDRKPVGARFTVSLPVEG